MGSSSARGLFLDADTIGAYRPPADKGSVISIGVFAAMLPGRTEQYCLPRNKKSGPSGPQREDSNGDEHISVPSSGIRFTSSKTLCSSTC